MASFPIANAALYAVAAVGIAAVGVVGWRATTGAPKAPPPAVSAPVAPPAASQTAAVAPQPQSLTPPAPPKPPLPEFDVVRVEPTGDAVIAGRAPAQSQVALYVGDKKLGETRADANGQFVIIPPPLSPGDHLLSLRASGSAGNVASEQTVAVSVTSKPGEKNVAAMTAPDKPTVILSEPARPQAVPAAQGAILAPTIAIRTAEAGEEGAFFASGVAPPGAQVRLYLNNSFVANVQTAPDGKWGLKVERGMAPGHYDVRADMVEAATGTVLARAEVPFDYPAPQVAARPAPPRPATAAIPQPPPRPTPAPVTAPAVATAPPVQTTTAPALTTPSPVVTPPPQPTAASAPAVVATPPVQTGSTPASPRPAATTPTTAVAIATAPTVQTTPPPAPGPVAAAAPAALPAPVVAPSGLAVVPEIHAVTVIRGDNLWRISRKVLGKGARYTQIYEANSSQIRDPNRIWPGQIFVAPRSQVN